MFENIRIQWDGVAREHTNFSRRWDTGVTWSTTGTSEELQLHCTAGSVWWHEHDQQVIKAFREDRDSEHYNPKLYMIKVQAHYLDKHWALNL